MAKDKHPIESRTLVALDLETSGVDPEQDRIIEFGAVKFANGEVVDRCSLLINPEMEVDRFVIELTGIKQAELDAAPTLPQVADRIEAFLEGCDLVAHNAPFDIGFIRSAGIHADGRVYDTLDMAQALLPKSRGYGLDRLADDFGIEFVGHHRALNDADATRAVFHRLVEMLMDLPVARRQLIAKVGDASDWGLGALALETLPRGGRGGLRDLLEDAGLELEERTEPNLKPSQRGGNLPTEPDEYLAAVEGIFAEDGLLSRALSGFKHRAGQADMARAVAQAMLSGERAVIEAGTGIGKSLAYLIPAVLYAVAARKKLVISTHTLTLQEQLQNKDMPVVDAIVKELDNGNGIQYATLKGKGNYLCPEEWIKGVDKPPAVADEAVLLGKIALWLPDTETGDRSEIGLTGFRNHHLTFSRYSGEECSCGQKRSRRCFLQKARQNAAAADVVIMNHSLSIANAVYDNSQAPAAGVMVVDEAHHLVDVATQQLSFRISHYDLRTLAENCLASGRGVVHEVEQALGRFPLGDAAGRLPSIAETGISQSRLERGSADFFKRHGEIVKEYRQRINDRMRGSDEWKGLVAGFEQLRSDVLQPLQRHLAELQKVLGEQMEAADSDTRGELEDVAQRLARNAEVLSGIMSNAGKALMEPQDGDVYWLESSGRQLGMSINGAPIDVSEFLGGNLLGGDVPTVLTGATLSTDGSLDAYKRSTGLEDAEDRMIKQGFDFERNAVVVCLSDAGSVSQDDQQVSVARAIAEVVRGADGRTLALFTSKTSLEKARRALAPLMKDAGFKLIAQGRDGSPHTVVEELRSNERILGMGVSSLWEGIDLGEDNLSALIVAKLPFPVPTDPIHEARAERFDDGFGEYSVPEALRRFKQGFGRLIRTDKSRGAFVVLDSRIIHKNYGQRFLRALPEGAARKRMPVSLVQEFIRNWFADGA